MAPVPSRSRWSIPFLLRGAGLFVIVYALTIAWFVVSDTEEPEALRLARTADGAGLVLSGAVADDDDRIAIVDAVGEITNVPVLIADLDVDPDAPDLADPIDTATDLAAALPPDQN